MTVVHDEVLEARAAWSHVVEAGRTEQRQASWAKRLLTNVGARVAGVVLNRAITDTEEYYYYYGTGANRSRKEARAR